MASRILRGLDESSSDVDPAGSSLPLASASIGIAIYPDDAEDRGELIQKAASAQSEAKTRRVPYLLFNEKLHNVARERLVLESDLLRAFEEEQLELHFQPVVDLSGAITGAVALIRWQHPRRGAVPPMDFIPLAEETGIIKAIGRFTMFTACRHLAGAVEAAGYRVTGYPPRTLATPGLPAAPTLLHKLPFEDPVSAYLTFFDLGREARLAWFLSLRLPGTDGAWQTAAACTELPVPGGRGQGGIEVTGPGDLALHLLRRLLFA